MSLELSTTLIRIPDAMTAPVDNEIVILNMAGNNYVSLDAIGRRIWDLLESAQTVGNMCTLLSQEFEATEEQIATDIIPFLAELVTDGLLRVVE